MKRVRKYTLPSQAGPASVRGTIYAKNMREGVQYVGHFTGHGYRLHGGLTYCQPEGGEMFMCVPSPLALMRPTKLVVAS